MNKLQALQASERHLAAVSKELNSLLALWDRNKLPDDFLSGDEYPFNSSLDEVAAEVDASLDTLRARLDQPMGYCSFQACQAHFVLTANPPYGVIHKEVQEDGETVIRHYIAPSKDQRIEVFEI